MSRILSFAAVALALMLTGCHGPANGLQRMYVLDCGRLIAQDQARWTPGINVGQPRELSNNCYLFRHARGTLLWETGVPDAVVARPDGLTSPPSSGSGIARSWTNLRISA